MPDTPNQNLEKQLRDYAQARRAAAGTPPMHPATRRILQAEVQRQFGMSGEPASPRVWQIIWTRFAVGSAVMAALVAMFVVLNRSEFEQPGDKFTLAKNEAAVAPSPTASSELKAMTIAGRKETEFDIASSGLRESLADAALERSDAAKDQSTAGYAALTAAAPAESRRAQGGTVQSPATASPSPASKPSSEVFFSTDSAASGRVMAKKAQPAPARTSAVTLGAGSDWAFNNATTQRFLNTAAPGGSAPLPVVLDEFIVEQTGNTLKIVDRDGSVYHGNIVAVTNVIEAFADADAQAIATAAATIAPESAAYREPPKQSSPANTADAAMQNSSLPAVNYAFEVAGTNRSLRQRVVFNGNWIQNVGAVNVQNTSNLTQRFQNQSTLPADAAGLPQNLQNQFINGRVYLGNSRSGTELNALPALEQQR